MTVLLMNNDAMAVTQELVSDSAPQLLLSSELYIHIIRWRVSVSDLKLEEVPLRGRSQLSTFTNSTESTTLG